MVPIFLLTYNEQDSFVEIYNDQFVRTHFGPNNIHFYVLDNGKQPKIESWCQRHGYTYYASEYNIGSSGGYNWIFKTAFRLRLQAAVLMQADVEITSAWPLLFTYQLTRAFGTTHFITWPQTFHHSDYSAEISYHDLKSNLPNLGNLVGFDPNTMHQKICYFDENYVVTHCDDLEFLYHMRTKNMNAVNAISLLPGAVETAQRFVLPGTETRTYSHVIKFNNEEIRIHHVSQHYESHDPWLAVNKPYYDLMWEQSQCQKRAPYDPARWQQFGYPAYPVQHELDRFFKKFPTDGA